MVRQTVLPFKLERTDETLTAHGGLALLAEFNHGLGLCGLTDRFAGSWEQSGLCPVGVCGSADPDAPAGGRSLEDLAS